MKKILLSALTLLAVVACSKFDDSEIWSELKEHEERIVKLETLCNQMNTNITSLQTIIIALQNNDYVTNIAPIKEGNKEIGYTITFAKSGSITVYHGKDGENGKDGQNGTNGTDGKDGQDGKDGKDGYTPKIGVKQHTDGQSYWTLDGNWLLDDNGNMIPTTGEDGKNGQDGEDGKDGTNGTDGTDGKDGVDGKDGQDGITPQLKIEDGYWYLSYDNGATWQKLGKATGNNGLDGANGADGEDGDSIIDSITQDEENVYFNLSDGQVITLMKRNSTTIDFRDLYVEAICVRNWDSDQNGELSYDEAAAVTTLGNAFTGNTQIVAFDELKHFTGLKEISPDAFKDCSSLWRVSLPKNIENICHRAFYGCSALEIVKFSPEDKLKTISGGWTDSTVKSELYGAFAYCTNLKYISLPASIETIEPSAFAYCSMLESISFAEDSKLLVIGGDYYASDSGYDETMSGAFMFCTSLRSIIIPSNVEEIGKAAFYGCTSLKIVEFKEKSKIKRIGGIADYIGTSVGLAGAFTKCTALESIVIPETIEEIENGAFYGCSSLIRLQINAKTPPAMTKNYFPTMSSNLNDYFHFQKTASSFKIYVPTGSLSSYKATTGWKAYSSQIVEQ